MTPPACAAQPPMIGPEPKKVYRAGSLTYTAAGVATLFVWLLWGDFCFTVFESIFSKFLPLYLHDLQASNTLVGILTGSTGAVVNVMFLPSISMASDRHRSRRGRRIPFLLWTTPGAVGALVLIGLSTEIGGALKAALAWLPWPVSLSAVILSVLCVFVLAYHFFNMVLVNLYQCLLRDVVPAPLMARFLALFRVVGTVGTFFFSWYVFPHVVEHRIAVCVGVGVTYLLAFTLMCWRVKEGEYPPPPPRDEVPSFARSYLVYFRELLSVPLYRNFVLMFAFVTTASTCASPFVTLFTRSTLNLSMSDMGQVLAWGGLGSAITYVPIGYLCDKFAPMRVAVVSLSSLMLSWALGYFVVRGHTSWLVYWVIVSMLPSVAWNLSFTALTMQIFPAAKFGQLSSGLSVLGYGGASIVGSFFAGRFIDLVGGDYRMIFVWAFAWFVAAVGAMLLVYRGWRRCGGPDNYVPPSVG